MRRREIAALVHRESVRSVYSGQLREDADFRDAAAGLQWTVPHAVRTRHRDEQHVIMRIEHDAVRTRPIRDETFQPAFVRVAVYTSGRVVHARLALIGEIKIAVQREREIVDAFEAFRECVGEKRLDAARRRIEHHDAQPVIRDEDTSVAVYREAVRPAVVCRRDVELAPG